MQTEISLTFLQKIALGVASATIIGGGGMVLTAHTDNARQEVRIERVESALDKVDELSRKLDQTNANLIILNERMEVLRNERRPSD